MQELNRAEHQGTCLVPSSRSLSKSLRRRLSRLDLVIPRRGLYARREYWEALSPEKQDLHILRGLAEMHDAWTYCSISAAVVYGFDVPFELLGVVHVRGRRGERTRQDRMVRMHSCGDAKVFTRQGVRVVDVYETLFGCMRDAPFDCAVAIVDSALRKGLDSGRLHRYVAEDAKGRKGVAAARRVLAFADVRAESGGESRMRVAIARLGFAAPELQVAIPDPIDRSKGYRVDFLWRTPSGEAIASELDGKDKYQDERMRRGRTAIEVLTAERRRESRLTWYRMPILRVSFDEVRDGEYFARVLKALGVPRDETQRLRVD